MVLKLKLRTKLAKGLFRRSPGANSKATSKTTPSNDDDCQSQSTDCILPTPTGSMANTDKIPEPIDEDFFDKLMPPLVKPQAEDDSDTASEGAELEVLDTDSTGSCNSKATNKDAEIPQNNISEDTEATLDPSIPMTILVGKRSQDSEEVDRLAENSNFRAFEYVQPLKCATLSATKRREIGEMWNEDYTGTLLQQASSRNAAGATESHTEQHLTAARHLLDEFVYIQAHMPDVKFSLSLLESIFWTLEEYLYPRVADLFHDRLDKLSPSVSAQLVSFMHDFTTLASKVVPDFESTRWNMEGLFQVYRKSVEQDMDRLIALLVSEYTKDENVRRNEHGFLVTDLAPQISFLLEQQREVLTGCLPEAYHNRVLETCSCELSRFAAALLQHVRCPEYQRQAGVHQYSALINECGAISDLISSFFDSKPDLADSLSTLWTQMSITLLTQMVNHIMHDLHDPEEEIFSSVGRDSWVSVGERVVATISDYLGDIREWLSNPNYFVPKLLRQFVDRCLQDYLTAFFTHTMECGVSDASEAASRIRHDRSALLSYFGNVDNNNEVSDYHGKGGFYTPAMIQGKFRILKHIANLTDPQVEPLFAQEDVTAVQRRFDCHKSGSPTILHLVGLRKRHEGDESADWLRVIAKAKKQLDDERDSGGNEDNDEADFDINDDLSAAAPNIRESRYVHHVRTGYRVQRQLSGTTKSYIASSRQLQRQQAKGLERLRNYAEHRLPEQLW